MYYWMIPYGEVQVAAVSDRRNIRPKPLF